jgi:FMN phosphatase YigB (HAD superfamily)
MTDLSGIRAILLDTSGVLYHRPREDRHLEVFLMQNGLKLRHRSIVSRGLRAALFDVRTGRISCDTFYDALLRLHGVEDETLFEAGRIALYRDAADIELFPGVVETLIELRDAHYRLGTVSDSGHAAGEKISWLSARGVPPGLWSAFVVSSDFGQVKSERMIFNLALDHMGMTAAETAFVGHNPDELSVAAFIGMMTIAFMPDDPAVEVDYTIGSFYELGDLFVGEEE